MAMSDDERASLAKGLGGTVEGQEDPASELEQEQPSEETQVADSGESKAAEPEVQDAGGEPEKVPYEELEKNYEALREGWQDVLGYTVAAPTEENPNARDWNYEEIVKDGGFDPKSLVKMGEEPKMEKVVSEETEEVDPRDATISEMRSRLELLEKSDEKTGAARMVGEVRGKYSDFSEFEVDIAKMIPSHKPKTAKDLEILYFAAKGQRGALNGGGQSAPKGGNLSSQGQSTARVKESGKDFHDEIFENIRNAGEVPRGVTTKQVQALFNKPQLAPMGGED